MLAYTVASERKLADDGIQCRADGVSNARESCSESDLVADEIVGKVGPVKALLIVKDDVEGGAG